MQGLSTCRKIAEKTRQVDAWRQPELVAVPAIAGGDGVNWGAAFDLRERNSVADAMTELSCRRMAKGDLASGRSLLREADRFRECGQRLLTLHCERHAMNFFVPATCKSRVCPDCGKRLYGRVVGRARKIIGKVLSRRPRGYFMSLVTLTFNKNRWGQAMPGRDDIKRAYRESSLFLQLYFGKWQMYLDADGRLRPKLKSGDGKTGRVWRGGGWLAVMEVGKDNNNLHVHCVTWGHYNSYVGMAAAWAKITGDSINPDFAVVADARQAANYVLKYITKPPKTDSFHRLAAVADMVKGTRRLRSGGVFFNALNLAPKLDNRFDCPFCGDDLEFRGYNYAGELLDAGRQAMLLPLREVVKARQGELIPTWSVLFSKAIAGDLRK